MNTTPDSQRVVPVELTAEMRKAFWKADELYEDGFGTAPDSQWAAMIAAAPAASPPVAPLAAAQDGVSVVAWRMLTSRGTVINGWIDGEPTDSDRAFSAEQNRTIELAYSRPPAQTQGAYEAFADRLDDWRCFASKVRYAHTQDDYNKVATMLAAAEQPAYARVSAPEYSYLHAPLPNPPASPEDRRDGERLDWLSTRLDSVDWSASDGTRLSFQWPVNAVVCADVRKTIDNAIDAARDDHEGV